MQACLKKDGVQMPQFRRGNGQPPNGQPPSGQRPQGGFRDSPEADKLRKALQKCGVKLPNRPPQQQGDTTNS